MKPPRRAFILTVEIGADTWERALLELQSLAIHIESHGPECDSVGGSPASSHIVAVTRNPEMTHDRYHEKLREYLKWLKERRK